MTWLILGQLPSEYLGIEVGKLAIFQGQWTQTFMQQTLGGEIADTEQVVSSFDYNGHLAFQLDWVQCITGDQTDTSRGSDTLWNNDPFLMDRTQIGDATVDAYYLKTPFSIGDKWGAGTEGTYHSDIDGDGLDDTWEIRADTMEVVGEEDVTVPAGTFHAFKIKETAIIAETQSSQTMIDSIIINSTRFLWWAPGTYAVKDSTHQDLTAYVFGTAYPGTADFWTELASITEVKEGGTEGEGPRLLTPVAGSLLRLSLPEGEPTTVRIFNPAGRELGSWIVRGPVAEIPVGSLPEGLYVITAGSMRATFLKR